MATKFPTDLTLIGALLAAHTILVDDGTGPFKATISQIPIASLSGAGGAATKNVGTAAGTVAAGDDSRFTDARTPTTHASTHASAGSDPIKLDDLASPDDNVDLNASTLAHGLLPKLSGSASDVLRGDGTYGAAALTAHATNHNSGGSDPITSLDNLTAIGTIGTVGNITTMGTIGTVGNITTMGTIASLSAITACGDVASIGNVTMADAKNIAVGTATGTKIGTSTSQKIGFFNATPVVQITGSTDILGCLVTLGLRAASSNPPLNMGTGALTCGTIACSAITITDANDIAVGSTTGTKLGTATTQKLGFWNATPVVQTTGSTDILAGLVTIGLRAASSNPPLNMGSGALTCGAVTCTTIANSGTQTFGDTANLAFNTSTGTKIGTATNQKMAFWNATPIVQPSGANQGAITDSTTGTAGFTLSDVTASHSQSILNNNFASLARLVDNIRTALVNSGIMKGAA